MTMKPLPHQRCNKARPSIVDVARAAGVSSKTVSNVLHNRDVVKPETRQRVEQVIADLQYHPNMVSRQLRYGKSNVLMLALPELTTTYFSVLAHEVMKYTRQKGYTLLITETLGDKDKEAQALKGIDTCAVDGIILSTLILTGDEVWTKRTDIPIVLLGERSQDSLITHVGIDNQASGYDLTTHLIDQGCRHILFLGADLAKPYGTGWLRMCGYRKALEQHGLSFETAFIRPCDYTYSAGMMATHMALHEGMKFDSLVCGNDAIAIGAMRELRINGIAVPNTVKVVGWDDSPEGRFSNPTLTSVAINVSKIAASAVDAVILASERQTTQSSEINVDYSLNIRESSTTLWTV